MSITVLGSIVMLPITGWCDWQDLTAKELKTMLDSGQDIVLLNPLSDLEFNEGYIPGSVNVPLHTIMQSKALPKNKDALIVTYCAGKQ